jgi:hypothetical protein
MVEYSSSGAHKEVHTFSELSGLVVNAHTTVDSQRSEFVGVVLNFGKFIRDLQSKLSCRS